MKLSILHGSSEIGGSCVKLTSGRNTIIIDMGMPLYDKEGKPFDKKNAKTVLPAVPGLYNKPYVDAILVSHALADHYGLDSYSAKEIPIYAGKGTSDLIMISQLLDINKIENSRFVEIQAGQNFKIGDFEITPYMMDHSAFESMAFYIKAGDKSIFYSGDFRAHGSRKWVFEKLTKEFNEKADVLLLEGTLIGGEERENSSEPETEKRITEELKKPFKGLTFASYSSQNIDRFKSFFKACLRTKKTLVIDPYAAYILEYMPPNFPKYDWNNIKVYCVNNRHSTAIFKNSKYKKFGRNKIKLEEIIQNPEKYVITDRYHIRKAFKPYLNKPKVIWSLWKGYLTEQKPFWDAYRAEIVQIHASGHADEQTLQRLVKAVKPGIIVPMHTQKPKLYEKVFAEQKIKICRDGEEIEI